MDWSPLRTSPREYKGPVRPGNGLTQMDDLRLEPRNLGLQLGDTEVLGGRLAASRLRALGVELVPLLHFGGGEFRVHGMELTVIGFSMAGGAPTTYSMGTMNVG